MYKQIKLDNEWSLLKLGSPIPGLYVQTGSEVVKIKGFSQIVGEKVITNYEIVITDKGELVASYKIVAEESKEAVERAFNA